jgi:AcrR family transcriptional regulator
MSSQEGDGTRAGTGAVVPLYARLPHGPHRLDHTQVIRHQRTRLHGAMVEAVAENGYAGTSVRQVVGLAGVSRRSFYEQYPNKEACFLATYDVIAARGVKRIRRAHEASEGTLEERLRASLHEFIEGMRANWKGARLVIVEAQTVGPAGLARLRGTTAACERMLSVSFERGGEEERGGVAMPVVRAIVGGLLWLSSLLLRKGSEEQLPTMAEEMLQWTLLFEPDSARPGPVSRTETAQRRAAHEREAPGARAGGGGDRERVLLQALRLALIGEYNELSALQIAEEANVSIDVFFEMFEGRDECFLAALDMLGDELLGLLEDAEVGCGEAWPRGVRRALCELTRYLAERPLYAHTIAAGAFAAGPAAAERNRQVVRRLSESLVAGAPAPAQSSIAVDAIAGAIGHTIRCQVAAGQIEQFATLCDPLAYVVIAPFLGADAAAAIVSEPDMATAAS